MSRSISLNLRHAMNAPETDKVPVVLVTIEHALLAVPLRFSTDPTVRLSTDPEVRYGTVSRGNTYTYVPLSYTPPPDGEAVPSTVPLTLGFYDAATAVLLRSTAIRAKVTVEVVLADTPDTVEQSFPPFDLAAAQITAKGIALSLAIDGLANEPYPADDYTPATHPGLFAR